MIPVKTGRRVVIAGWDLWLDLIRSYQQIIKTAMKGIQL